ncbi:MAG: TAXI family TRAP transporter solute-binding subunit [Geminicoccaceae bacterium]
MHRSLAMICCLSAALAAGGWQAQAEGRTALAVAVGAAGTDSFVFGTELWAVGEFELLPKHELVLEMAVMEKAPERLQALNDAEVDFALLRQPVPTSFARDLRTVMVLWPSGEARAGAETTQFLVRKDVSEELVYLVTRTVFEQAQRLRGAHETMGIGTPSDATVGAALPVHPGAHRFYQEHAKASDPVEPSPSPRPDIAQKSDAGESDSVGADERRQLLAACRDARERGALGHFNGDQSISACNAPVIGASGLSLDPSHGQGGPKIMMDQGGDAVRQQPASGFHANRPAIHGLWPTM